MSNLKTLYRKELRGERDTFVGYGVILLLIAVLSIVLYIWRPQTNFLALPAILLGWLPVWLLYISFDSMAREWRDKSVTFLRSLPVPAWQIIVAKTLAAWTFYLILAIAIYFLFVFVGFIYLKGALSEVLLPAAAGVVAFFLLIAPLTPVVFVIYLSGVTFNMAANVIRFLSAAAAAVLIAALSLVLSSALGLVEVPWVIPGQIDTHSGIVNFYVNTVTLHLSIPLSILAVGVLSFFASVRLLNRSIWP